MNGVIHSDPHYSSDFAEVDPTGRYGRYNEVLGRGSSKTVYKAFDEYEGIEVAWNQVKLNEFLQSSEDLQRLYCEIHLLKTLKHDNIMKFYASWFDVSKRNVNFITEMFTSGTLRQYRLKHKRVSVRAVKHWSRQILKGLQYLHTHDPPVIHRDLKCDNIFINGNQGEVKIGDLGLAAILQKTYADHIVGTPEFMAPEVYNEEYNELVDIYSFGMCILELVTLDYPYSECTTPAQIYKKVISGTKPDAFYKLKDPEVRDFVEKCIATVSQRLSARELLEDPFLQMDVFQSSSDLIECQLSVDGFATILRKTLVEDRGIGGTCSNKNSNSVDTEDQITGVHIAREMDGNGFELFEYEEDENPHTVNISIKGKHHADGRIYLRLRLVDNEEKIRSIYFPFDIENDTALSVANEMVAQLDMLDQDEINIAQMIDGEVAALIPEWKTAMPINDDHCFKSQGVCQNCASGHKPSGYFMACISHSSVCTCTTTHGRFEEVTYRLEDGSEHAVMEDAPSIEFSSSSRNDNHSEDENGELGQLYISTDMGEILVEDNTTSVAKLSFDYTKESVISSQVDDGGGRIGTCSVPNFYEADEQSFGHRNFPKTGALEYLNYKQKNVSRKYNRSSLIPTCVSRTRSMRVDDIDVWTLYYETLHQCF